MFTEDGQQAVLLDFQAMTLLHPARNLWFFLAVGTDADFRLLLCIIYLISTNLVKLTFIGLGKHTWVNFFNIITIFLSSTLKDPPLGLLLKRLKL